MSTRWLGFILGFWFRFPAFGLDLGGVGWLDLGPVVVGFVCLLGFGGCDLCVCWVCVFAGFAG